MNNARTRMAMRDIVGDIGNITAELRKPTPYVDYAFIARCAQAIAQAALDIESAATAEILPQLLDIPAAN